MNIVVCYVTLVFCCIVLWYVKLLSLILYRISLCYGVLSWAVFYDLYLFALLFVVVLLCIVLNCGVLYFFCFIVVPCVILCCFMPICFICLYWFCLFILLCVIVYYEILLCIEICCGILLCDLVHWIIYSNNHTRKIHSEVRKTQ